MPHTQTRIRTLDAHWEWKQRDPALHSALDELALPSFVAGAADAEITSADADADKGADKHTDTKKAWRAATAFPSEVHVELLAAGLIPDPFVGFNEHAVQWIGHEEWLYRTTFALDALAEGELAELVFDGLDTVVDVYLNGHAILSADNQFREYTVALDPTLLHFTNSSTDTDTKEDKESTDNILLLHFKSALALAKAREAQYGRVRAGSANLGDPSRVYVRKAQYDWRWDWGPELMTTGPYRPIHLRLSGPARLAHIHARTTALAYPALALDVDLAFASHTARTHVGSLKVGVELREVGSGEGEGRVVRSEVVNVPVGLGSGEGEEGGREETLRDVLLWAFRDGEVALWWPAGHGAQVLYDVVVVLLDEEGNALDRATQRVGFRSIALVQEPLAHADQYGTGSTFLFEVNGVRVFIGGSNWIPADNLLTRITPARYRAWLALLRAGNQNMVRLWGGGVYEPDVFYDACDELGILIWQDFQFACGIYPAHASFVASVRAEARDTVRRLRHHAALALFCGNNEDYQQVLQWDVHTDLPARVIYEQVLPEAVEALTGPSSSNPKDEDGEKDKDKPRFDAVAYHRGSPYGGDGWDTSDPTVGDVHQWNVWGGKERAWQEYEGMGGRFVSEFGIPSFPSLPLIKYWAGEEGKEGREGKGEGEELHAQAPVMAQHCRAGMHERRFAILMNENFRVSEDLETYAFRTQVLQSEAVGFAYRVWRREWRGPGREFCGGVLVWQLNDCWPVTSWAIADYYLRPKPVFYTIARELAPIAVGILRTVTKNRENDRPKQFYEFGAFQTTGSTLSIWGANNTLTPQTLTLHLDSFLLPTTTTTTTSTDTLHPFNSTSHPITLPPNRSTPLLEIPLPLPHGANAADGVRVVVHARLRDAAGVVMARASDWPQPFRYVRFPDPGLRLVRVPSGVRVEVRRPVKALVLSLVRAGKEEGEGAVAEGEWEWGRWSDNALDLVPGDAVVVRCEGLEEEGVKVRAAWMGRERAKVVPVEDV
ncbi:glycoside hydrolase [Dentipellis sp. KUC8613]|nr:glycoside hydrolase [Dentipellis sp. KUC8613]